MGIPKEKELIIYEKVLSMACQRWEKMGPKPQIEKLLLTYEVILTLTGEWKGEIDMSISL